MSKYVTSASSGKPATNASATPNEYEFLRIDPIITPYFVILKLLKSFTMYNLYLVTTILTYFLKVVNTYFL